MFYKILACFHYYPLGCALFSAHLTPSPGLGASPFPTPPPSEERRIQPPRKKKKPQWISDIKSGTISTDPDKLRTGKLRGRFQPVMKKPEKWVTYIYT